MEKIINGNTMKRKLVEYLNKKIILFCKKVPA